MTTKFSKVIPYLKKKKNMEVLEMVESDFFNEDFVQTLVAVLVYRKSYF